MSDISWWMRCLAENIARQRNREDNTTGHFWESRFKAQLLLDESAVLACAAYVDLNPIRAAMTERLETSQFTGVKDRIDDLRERSDRSRMSDHEWERSRRRQHSGWISPIEINERDDAIGSDTSRGGRRASEKGFLSISLSAYLELVDWTGRQIRRGKRGAIPKHLAPILTRLGLDAGDWCEVVTWFGPSYKRVIGSAENLKAEAARRGQGWLQSPLALT